MTGEGGASVGRHAPLATGIALALPTLVAHYPPMTDLPLHEGVVGVLRHLGDEAFFPRDLYHLNLGHPNQLFHLASWLLSYAVGTRWAVKLVIAAAQIAILVAGARMADHLGRSRWAALLLAPLALGFTYYWGLVTNLLGFAALLGALPAIDRLAVRPTARSAGVVCGWLVLLYLAHESVLVLAIFFSASLALLLPLEGRNTALRLAPGAFGLALGVCHHFVNRRSFGTLQLRVSDTFPPLSERIRNVPNDLFGSHDALALAALFGLGLTAIGLFAKTRIRAREPRPVRGADQTAPRHVRDVLFHYRFEAAALVFAVLFFVAPSSWNSNNLLYSRLAGPAWALFALTSAPRIAPSLLARLVPCALPLAVLLAAWPQFVDSHDAYRDLDTVLRKLPRDRAVLLCNVDRAIVNTRIFGAGVGAARALAERGGRTSLSLVTSPIAPAQLDPRFRWNEFDERTRTLAPAFILPAHDLSRFGYAIVHSRDPFLLAVVRLALRPDAEVVAEVGEWLLLRSTHPPIPPDSADAQPRPGLPTLSDRMNVILAELRPTPSRQP